MERKGTEEVGGTFGQDGVGRWGGDILSSRPSAERVQSVNSFSIQQSRQSYSHMDMDLKATLRDKLEEVAPEYGLVELHYPSFMRAFGYRCAPLSAADGVEGLNALLEAATGIRVEIEQDGGKGGGEWFGATKAWTVSGISGSNAFAYKEDKAEAEADGNDELGRHARIEQKRCEKNFWVSYDAMQE